MNIVGNFFVRRYPTFHRWAPRRLETKNANFQAVRNLLTRLNVFVWVCESEHDQFAWPLGDSHGQCLGYLRWDVNFGHASVGTQHHHVVGHACGLPPWMRSIVGTEQGLSDYNGDHASISGSSMGPCDGGLWARLVNEGDAISWGDFRDDEHVLEQAVADSHDGNHFCECADPQWGPIFVCPVCSLRAGKTAWVARDHWGTCRHESSVKWAGNQLEWIAWEKSKAKHGAGASAAASPSPAAAAWNDEPWVETFHPTSYRDGDAVHGAFIVDSFHYLKKGDGSKSLYLPRVLQYLKEAFGLTFMAVCSGGAALSRPGGKYAATYDQMLAYLPEGGVRFLIAIVCGNDWYGWPVHPLGTDVMDAAQSLCRRMREMSRYQYAVVGGSSAVWGYERGGMSVTSMEQYDENGTALERCFLEHGVCACTRADELHGVEVFDSIGHIRASSFVVVQDAYFAWVEDTLIQHRVGLEPDDGSDGADDAPVARGDRAEDSDSSDEPAAPPPPPA